MISVCEMRRDIPRQTITITASKFSVDSRSILSLGCQKFDFGAFSSNLSYPLRNVSVLECTQKICVELRFGFESCVFLFQGSYEGSSSVFGFLFLGEKLEY